MIVVFCYSHLYGTTIREKFKRQINFVVATSFFKPNGALPYFCLKSVCGEKTNRKDFENDRTPKLKKRQFISLN